MKKIISFCFFFVLASALLAQNDTFDLVEFIPPKNWKKEVGENSIGFTITNQKSNGWCRIQIVKSTASKGSIDLDFESEWQELVVKNYQPPAGPDIRELPEKDGWKMKFGFAIFTFDDEDAIVMLTTMSGFDRCVSISTVANNTEFFEDVKAFMVLLNLKKPETPVNQQADGGNINITGTWIKQSSMHEDYRNPNSAFDAGYRVDQYTFLENGTYQFYSKVFRMTFDKILFVRENGTYDLSGNLLTVRPAKSVIEAWSKDSVFENGKQNGTDRFGKLLSTQGRPLEKTTYRLTNHYFSGIDEWSLVFQSDTATLRDGSFTSDTLYTNAWYYGRPIAVRKPPIEIPGRK